MSNANAQECAELKGMSPTTHLLRLSLLTAVQSASHVIGLSLRWVENISV